MVKFINESQFKLIQDKLGINENKASEMFSKNEIIVYKKNEVREPSFKYIRLKDKYSQLIFVKI